tara:strand:- start:158 stop:1093 length:936 start_codon:yes stop_codon:yes gene_type:complete
MIKNSYLNSRVYKDRIKRGLVSYKNYKPYDLRYYLKPSDRFKIKKLLSILLNPIEYLKRLLAFKFISNSSSSNIFVNKDGYVKFSADNIYNGKEFLDKICKLVEEKRKQHKNNKFDGNEKYIIPIEEVVNYSFIMDFAVSDDLIKIASNYLKTIPVLYAVQLWQGQPNEYRAGSPVFHLDGLDSSCLRIYLYLNDVTKQNGPFAILPKSLSKKVVKKTGYYSGNIPDEEIYKIVNKSDLIEVEGKKGTMVAGDTTKCFHYGSRIEKGERLVIIFTYSSYFHNDPEIKLSRDILSAYKPKNRIQNMVINGPR